MIFFRIVTNFPKLNFEKVLMHGLCKTELLTFNFANQNSLNTQECWLMYLTSNRFTFVIRKVKLQWGTVKPWSLGPGTRTAALMVHALISSYFPTVLPVHNILDITTPVTTLPRIQCYFFLDPKLFSKIICGVRQT